MYGEKDELDLGEKRGEGLRLWYARQAVTQGERLLADAQARHDGLFARAASILGWDVAITSALLVATLSRGLSVVALLAGAVGFLSAFACIAALWPRDWHNSALEPDWFIAEPYATELEALEALGGAYGKSFRDNNRVLHSVAFWLKLAWAAFGLIPVTALAVYLILVG